MNRILLTALAYAFSVCFVQAQTITPDEARTIAKEAYIYGFPLVENYRVQYSYFVDPGSPEFKGGWNKISNTARVYTPDDKTIQSPNSDTPYSFVGADLRAEPLVFTVPAIETGRYYSLQFIDMYTYNFGYVGSRTTGNGAGHYLLAGPKWNGEKPDGINAIIRSETDFAFVIYRTQMFNPADIENVKKIQSGYKVRPLSEFLGKPSPAAAPVVNFIKPLSVQDQRTSLDFFNELNFVLQFCPTNPSEQQLMARFAKIGIGAGKTFDAQTLPPDIRKAVEDGIADAWKEFNAFKESEIDTGKVRSGDMVGTRDFLGDHYLYRMAAALLGIYGNSKEEAMYPVYFVDASGQKMDGSGHRLLRCTCLLLTQSGH